MDTFIGATNRRWFGSSWCQAFLTSFPYSHIISSCQQSYEYKQVNQTDDTDNDNNNDINDNNNDIKNVVRDDSKDKKNK